MSGNLKDLGFDASQHEIQSTGDFQPLPAGWYNCIITESDMHQTKKGDGEYLKLRIEIMDNDYDGRVVFDNLNLDNPNPKAVQIAQQRLTEICHALGIMTPSDSSEFHDKPLSVKLKIDQGNSEYGPSNKVVQYGQSNVNQVNKGTKTPQKNNKAPWE